MAFHRWQVNFDEDGEIETAVQLPDPPVARKRTIIVTEETLHKAKRAALDLYSLAE